MSFSSNDRKLINDVATLSFERGLVAGYKHVIKVLRTVAETEEDAAEYKDQLLKLAAHLTDIRAAKIEALAKDNSQIIVTWKD